MSRNGRSFYAPTQGLFYCLKFGLWYSTKNDMGRVMKYLLKRLKEPSTYASLSAACAALSSVPVLAHHALTASAVFAAIGILLKENNEN